MVIQKQKDIIPVEIKNTETLERSDLRGLVYFMKRFHIEEGLLLCRSMEEIKTIEDMRIKIQPFWSWLIKGSLASHYLTPLSS